MGARERRLGFILALGVVTPGCDGCAKEEAMAPGTGGAPAPVEETVFFGSQSFPSPSGEYAASVGGWRSSNGTGQSQAEVGNDSGGSGLIAFSRAHVDMAFEWRSDEHLVVRYPDDLPPPRIDATNSSFGMGGRGRVEYIATPREGIPKLHWSTEGTHRVLAERALERGGIVTFEYDGEVTYSYSYYDVAEPDASVDLLQNLGWQGGGPSWAGIIYGLVALRAPHTSVHLEYNPEGDGLSVESDQMQPLLTVAKLVAEAKRDPALLRAAIQRAARDHQME